jgi:hypothetical protein
MAPRQQPDRFGGIGQPLDRKIGNPCNGHRHHKLIILWLRPQGKIKQDAQNHLRKLLPTSAERRQNRMAAGSEKGDVFKELDAGQAG